MTTSSTAAESARRRAPRADCVADAAGNVVFELSTGLTEGPGALVLRPRGAAGLADEVRLPLTPAGAGRARAVLDAGTELAEGRWDAYVDGRAVETGVRDVRALMAREHVRTGPVSVRIPQPTPDGGLAVRSWLRAPHAEAGDLAFGPASCTVQGRLHGAVWGAGAVAEARLGERIHQVPVTGIEETFTFTLPYAPLAEGTEEPGGTAEPEGSRAAGAGASGAAPRLWELWLRPAEDAEPVRIARLLDDIWDRRTIFVYPDRTVGDRTVTPVYTSANDLCVRVS